MKLTDMPLSEGALDLGLRLGLDIVVVSALVLGLYLRRREQRDFAFTFLVFNVLIFLVTYVLSSSAPGVGVAFGLFAVFSVMRYRTETIPIREMTFLFAAVSIAMVNAIAGPGVSLVGLLTANVVIFGVTGFLHLRWYGDGLPSVPLRYERLALLAPDARALLLDDLRERTGLDVVAVEVVELDLLRDTATLKVSYKAPREG